MILVRLRLVRLAPILAAVVGLIVPRVFQAQTAVARELPLKHAPQATMPEITPADLMTRLYIFSDDSMQGRRVGTEGHRRGTAYIEHEVRKLGLVPAGDSGGYFQNLPVFERTLAAGQTLSVGGTTFKPWVDYLPRDNGPNVRALSDAPVIFGGLWGDSATMISPSAAAGKFIVIAVPDGPDGTPQWQVNRPLLTRFYVDAAGIAIASLDAMDPRARETLAEPTVDLQSPEARVPPMPAFLYVSRAMSDALLGGPTRGLTRGKVSGKTVSGSLRFADTRAPARNVVAILPGSDPLLKGE